MLPKALIRFVVLVLVPALLVDPSFAAVALSKNGSWHHFSKIVPGTIFVEQALEVEGIPYLSSKAHKPKADVYVEGGEMSRREASWKLAFAGFVARLVGGVGVSALIAHAQMPQLPAQIVTHIRAVSRWIYLQINPATGLAASHPGDPRTGNWSITYDNAQRIMEHIQTGDLDKARKAMDFYLTSRAIRKNGEWIVNAVDAATGQPVESVCHSGPNLYLGLAAIHLYEVTRDVKYLNFARERWTLVAALQNQNTGGVRMGPRGETDQPGDQHFSFDPKAPAYYSLYLTEHNTEFKALSDLLYGADSVAPDRQKYQRASSLVGQWAKSVFDPETNLFYSGSTDVAFRDFEFGVQRPVGPIKSHPMDATGLMLSAFGPEGLDQLLGNGKAEDIRKALDDHFKVTVTHTPPEGQPVTVSGYDFMSGTERDGRRNPLLWDEGSTWAAFADLRFQDYFTRRGDTAKAAAYRAAFEDNARTQASKSAIRADGGIAYAYALPVPYSYGKPTGWGLNIPQGLSTIGGVARSMGMLASDPFLPRFGPYAQQVTVDQTAPLASAQAQTAPANRLYTQPTQYLDDAWKFVNSQQWQKAADMIDRMRSEHPDWIALAKTQEQVASRAATPQRPFAMIGPDGSKEDIFRKYFMLYHVGTAEFIRAKAYERLGQRAKALESALAILRDYPHAQADGGNTFWQPARSLAIELPDLYRAAQAQLGGRRGAIQRNGRFDWARNLYRSSGVRVVVLAVAMLLAPMLAHLGRTQTPIPLPVTPAAIHQVVPWRPAVMPVATKDGIWLDVEGQLQTGIPGFAYQPVPINDPHYKSIADFHNQLALLYKSLLPPDGAGIDAARFPDLVKLAKDHRGAPARDDARDIAEHGARFIRIYDIANTTPEDRRMVLQVTRWMYERYRIKVIYGMWDPTVWQAHLVAEDLIGQPGVEIVDGWNEINLRHPTEEKYRDIERIAGAYRIMDPTHPIAIVVSQSLGVKDLLAIQKMKNIQIVSVTVFSRDPEGLKRYIAGLQAVLAPKIVTIAELGVPDTVPPDERARLLGGLASAVTHTAADQPSVVPYVAIFSYSKEGGKGKDDIWGVRGTPAMEALANVWRHWVPGPNSNSVETHAVPPQASVPATASAGSRKPFSTKLGFDYEGPVWMGRWAPVDPAQSDDIRSAEAIAFELHPDVRKNLTGFAVDLKGEGEISVLGMNVHGDWLGWHIVRDDGEKSSAFVVDNPEKGTVMIVIPMAEVNKAYTTYGFSRTTQIHIQTGIVRNDDWLNTVNVPTQASVRTVSASEADAIRHSQSMTLSQWIAAIVSAMLGIIGWLVVWPRFQNAFRQSPEHLSLSPYGSSNGVHIVTRNEKMAKATLLLMTATQIWNVFTYVIVPIIQQRYVSAVINAPLVVLITPMVLLVTWILVNSIGVLLFPADDLTANTKYYSTIPKEKPADQAWPWMTIPVPVATENFADVIRPTLLTALASAESYRKQGGQANIVVYDDGLMRLVDGAATPADLRSLLVRIEGALSRGETPSDAEREAWDRVQFYRANGIGVVARPKEGRLGRFPKGSNLNAGWNLADRLEERLQAAGLPYDNVGDRLQALTAIDHEGLFVEGDIGTGDIFGALLDKDSVMPTGVMEATAPEFLTDPQLAYTQHRMLPYNEEDNFFTTMTGRYLRNLFQMVMPFTTRGGDHASLMGHNAFLRKSAMRDVALRDANGRILYWSENQVAEDFDLLFRLHSAGYFGRYVAYPGLDFGEGLRRTFTEEAAWLRKIAFGTSNLMLNPIREWREKGILQASYRDYMSSPLVPMHTKVNLNVYLISYYGFAVVFLAAFAQIYLLPFGKVSEVFFPAYAFIILLQNFFISAVFHPLSLSMLRHRLQRFPQFADVASHWLQSFKQELKAGMKYFGFFAGLPVWIIQGVFSHLLDLPMRFGATNMDRLKDKGLIVIFKEIGQAHLKQIVLGLVSSGWLVFSFMHMSAAVFWGSFTSMVILAVGAAISPFAYNPLFTRAASKVYSRVSRSTRQFLEKTYIAPLFRYPIVKAFVGILLLVAIMEAAPVQAGQAAWGSPLAYLAVVGTLIPLIRKVLSRFKSKDRSYLFAEAV